MAVFTHAATRQSEPARPVQAWFPTSTSACVENVQGVANEPGPASRPTHDGTASRGGAPAGLTNVSTAD